MTLAALVTWLITAGAGLYLLTIWLIEYDREFQSAAATRLPVPVISTHALLAVSGLAIWGVYLVTDRPRLAWAAASILVVVAILGFTLAARWIRVYRAYAAPVGSPGDGHSPGRDTRCGQRVHRPAGTAFSAAGGDRPRSVRHGHACPGAADRPGRGRKLNGLNAEGVRGRHPAAHLSQCHRSHRSHRRGTLKRTLSPPPRPAGSHRRPAPCPEGRAGQPAGPAPLCTQRTRRDDGRQHRGQLG